MSRPPVVLSTASVYPESAAVGFELAAGLGYEGVELMVWTDPISQDVPRVARLAERFDIPVRAVHAPCLAVTQRVWHADPVRRLRRSVDAAQQLGAPLVVLHPPFLWQRSYARVVAAEIDRAWEISGVTVAMENMFPIALPARWNRLGFDTYLPGHDPTVSAYPSWPAYPSYTLDLSHTAAAGSDALELLDRMGERLAHVHLADGSGVLGRDEHLVPGRGGQPCAQVSRRLVERDFRGVVVIEVSTRRCRTRDDRVAALDESLRFARAHLHPGASA